jgi:zinc transport system permease protein
VIIDDFILRAVLGGVGTALAAGPLGCFVVWRRMAYFGSALSHAALLGVAIGYLLAFDVTASVMGVCTVVALLLVAFEQQRLIATDTALGILAHSSLALGVLLLVSLLETVRVDLLGYLFGDVLAIRAVDLYVIYGTLIATIAVTVVLWRPLLLATVHEEMASAEGVHVLVVRTAFVVLLALVIAIGMKVVGVLLIVSLLLLPPATARRIARTPAQMAIGAALVGAVSVVLGVAASYYADTPAGPSIVIAATVLFLLSWVLPRGGRAAVPGQ